MPARIEGWYRQFRDWCKGPPPPFRPPQPRSTTVKPPPVALWPPDRPLVWLTPFDYLTHRDLNEGVLCLGNIGSGKSSTTGTMIPLAALRDGWSILTFTTKPDDVDQWQQWCRETGRSKDLIIIRLDGKSHFNLIDYELKRHEGIGTGTVSLATMLAEIFQHGRVRVVASEASLFFESSMLVLLCNSIDLLQLAGERVRLETIARLIETAPRTHDQIGTQRWHQGYCCSVLSRADAATEGRDTRRLYETVSRYFLSNWPSMDERTSGNILATLEAALFQMAREPLRTLLDSDGPTTFVPEMFREGAVIVVDTPASRYGAAGKLASQALKSAFESFLRRRARSNGDATRPILMFIDECQSIISREDAEFFQVCRSNGIACVCMTQSIDNIEVALGGEAHVNSLANALTTLVCHCTTGRTAEWVERRIAPYWKAMRSTSFSGRGGEGSHPSTSTSSHLYPQVLAAELARLRTGGIANKKLVDAVILKPGRSFRVSQAPFVRVTFEQR